jgi:hypothetical protein
MNDDLSASMPGDIPAKLSMFSSSSNKPPRGGLEGGIADPFPRELGHAIGLCSLSFAVKPFWREPGRPLYDCLEAETANGELPRPLACGRPLGVKEKCFVFDGGAPRGVVERRFVLDRRLSGVDGGSDGTVNIAADGSELLSFACCKRRAMLRLFGHYAEDEIIVERLSRALPTTRCKMR